MIAKLNGVLKEIGIEPLADYSTQIVSYEQRQGLAEAYGIRGFREFLQREINVAIKASALIPETLEEMAAAKMRIVTLQELNRKMKNAFDEYEKIKKGSVVK